MTTETKSIGASVTWYKYGGVDPMGDDLGGTITAPSGWTRGSSVDMTGVSLVLPDWPTGPGGLYAYKVGGGIVMDYQNTSGVWQPGWGGFSNSWVGATTTHSMGTHNVGAMIRCRTYLVTKVTAPSESILAQTTYWYASGRVVSDDSGDDESDPLWTPPLSFEARASWSLRAGVRAA